MRKIITSESVNCGHPDKTCDIIADSFLDEALRQDKDCQMAVECAIKDNMLMIYGETTTTAKINYEEIAKEVLKDIGYKEEFNIVKTLSQQSPNIANAVKKDELCANDQGIMFGYACNENAYYMPYPIIIAHRLMKVYDDFRRKDNRYFADAKSQVSVAYENDKPVEIDTILMSVSHQKGLSRETIVEDLKQNVIIKVLKEFANLKSDNIKYVLNPSGEFYIWGSFSDSGCVGRKIIVDTYGGYSRHGGGAFSGKDPTKVDRSAAYAARYVAKNIVAAGLADKCEIELAYAIGVAKPVSIFVETFGTGKISDDMITKLIEDNFDLRPAAIIKQFDLRNLPAKNGGKFYQRLAAYGHMGRVDFDVPWEHLDKVELLKKEATKLTANV